VNAKVLEDLFGRYALKKGIFSSVAGYAPEVTAFLKERLHPFIVPDETTPVPLRIGYETPETLGRDRLAAAVGAATLQPGRDLLVIDAGTAITFEVVEASGLYLGGNISPGLETRLRALHDYTKQLPLVSAEGEVPLLGSRTETAIRAGVVNGMVYEMQGYISDLQKRYPSLVVFLTGGHSFYFERRLKTPIFAAFNLVLTGLNSILEHNVEH
jgi:type III pantothenate kinase